MDWWLILIIIVLAAAVLLGLAALHPIRLQVEGSAAAALNLQIILKPFGIFPGKVKIVDIKDRPWGGEPKTNAENETAQDDNEEQDKEKPKKNFAEQLPFGKGDILPMVDKMLGALQVEDLDLQVNLSGDPYRSGVACGALWTFFGGGFAFISHRVKKFTNHPKMNFGVDLDRPWLAYFRLRIMIRVGDLGRLGFHVLSVVIRNRRENKKSAKAVPAAEN